MFVLPAALAEAGYALRSEEDADTPFLIDLFATTRASELAQVPWSDAQKRAFVEQQFAAQRHHYRTTIDDCTFDVLERDGVPIGRLYLQERQTQVHIVDIALMPDACGQGLGTALLTAIAADAATRGKAVGIFVERFNPALRLYQRLGFTLVRDEQIYLEMERLPGAVPVDQLNTAS